MTRRGLLLLAALIATQWVLCPALGTAKEAGNVVTLQAVIALPPERIWRHPDEADCTGPKVYKAFGLLRGIQQRVGPQAAALHLTQPHAQSGLAQTLIPQQPAAEMGALPNRWRPAFCNFPAPATETGITSQLRNLGRWLTLPVDPDQPLERRLGLVPGAQRPDEATLRLALQAFPGTVDDPRPGAYGHADVLGTYSDVLRQADLLIRNAGEAAYIGDGIYNDDGAKQTTNQSVRPYATASYDVLVQNDGTDPDQFVVRSPGVSLAEITAPGWSVTVSRADTGEDITTQVFDTGWVTPQLARGGTHALRLDVTPSPSVPPGQFCQVLLGVAPLGEDRQDAVLARTQAARSSQPDLLIRNHGEPQFIGDGIYNTTAQGQTRAQTAMAGQPAVYQVKLQNDGNTTAGYIVHSPGITTRAVAPVAWSVAVFDAATEGNNITADVLGGGWESPALAPGQELLLRMEVVPLPGAPGSEVCEFLLLATQKGSTSDADAVAAHTENFTIVRPDALIRAGVAGGFLGDDVYNADGADQTASLEVGPGGAAAYRVKVENDGNVQDRLRVTCPAASVSSLTVSGWTITIIDPADGSDVTAQVMGGGWLSPGVQPNGTAELDVQVRPSAEVPGGQVCDLAFTARSETDPARSDTVVASTTCANAYRPDVVVRCWGDAGSAGDGVYDPSGEGQQVDLTTPSGQPAVYEFRVQNDGNVPDRFALSAPRVTTTAVADGDWTIVILQGGAGGADITGQVMGDRYTTGLLQPGAAASFRAEVTPGPGAGGGSAYILRLAARSVASPGAADAARAKTVTRVSRQPDLLIRAADQPAFLGDGVYESSGAGQTVVQQALTGAPVTWDITLQNDGNVPERFLLRSPGISTAAVTKDGWTVTIRSGEGEDVTDAVLGGGWVSPELLPGGTWSLTLQMGTSAGVASSRSGAFLLVATAVHEAADTDAVLATAEAAQGQQPDLLVQPAGAPNYMGDGVYNDTGQGQTATGVCAEGQAAVFAIRLQNDGSRPDQFILRSPGVSTATFAQAGWTVTMYDAQAGGQDITAQVLEGGWVSPEMTPGASVDLRVEVTASHQVPGGQACSFLLQASSAQDGLLRDAVLVSALNALQRRPDGLVRNPDEPTYAGDGVYNTTGVGQTRQQGVPVGGTATFLLRFDNDGNAPDSLLVSAVSGGTAGGWSFRFFDAPVGGADVTAAVMGVGWGSGTLPVGASTLMRVEMTAGVGVGGNAHCELRTTVRSAADPDASDTVLTAVTTHEGQQPDLLIRSHGEAAFSGNNVYNTTGDAQSRTQVAEGSTTAVYHVAVENDGDASDTVVLTGSVLAANPEQWNTRFYDALTAGSDITAQVLYGGWSTGPLAPGDQVLLRVEVTPAHEVAGAETAQVLVTGRSASDSTRRDTVCALTMRKPHYQPDMLVGPSDEQLVGQGVLNATGDDQTVTLPAGVARPARFIIQARNAGNAPDSMRLVAAAVAPARLLASGWTATFFDAPTGGNDITAAVMGTGWTSPAVKPGGAISMLLELRPGASVPGASSQVIQLSALSVGDPSRVDVVRAVGTADMVHQPDLVIRNRDETTSVGEGIYNATGASQTAAQSAGNGLPAIYEITLQNDGNVPDSFVLQGSGVPPGWTVTAHSGEEITSDVLGDGWESPLLAAASSTSVQVNVSPAAGIPGGSVASLLLTARSRTDGSRLDSVRAETTAANRCQPDAEVSVAGGPSLGAGVINPTGDGQEARGVVDINQAAVYHLRVTNTGNVADRFRVKLAENGVSSAANDWSLSVFDAPSGGFDITSAVQGTGWLSSSVAAAAAVAVRVEVRPRSNLPENATHLARFVITSGTDSARVDAVRCLTTRGFRAPDLLLRRAGESSWHGDGVRNATGDGQMVAATVDIRQPVSFVLQVENDGTLADSLRVRVAVQAAGGGRPDGWRVQLFDAETGGSEITAAATGAGWVTGPVAPGGARSFRAQVEASTAQAAASSVEALVTAVSVADATKLDAVKLTAALVPATEFIHDFPAGRSLMGIPGVPRDDAAVLTLLGTNQAVRWDANAQTYEYAHLRRFDLEPGMGCWVRYDAPHTVRFWGYPLHAPVIVGLEAGWNLLANPFVGDLPWNAVSGGPPVAPYAWKLNDTGTGYRLVWGLRGADWEDSIGPWQGFWLRALEPATVSLGVVNTATDPGPSPVAWTIRLAARAQEAVDEDNFVGLSRTGGRICVANPPPLGGRSVDLFVCDAMTGRNAVDIAAANGDTTWELCAVTSIPHAEVSLTWPDLSRVPRDLAVTLTDLGANRSVNMRTTGAYTFRSGPEGAQRTFRLTVRPRGATPTLVTSVSVRPCESGLQVVYSLASAAEVRVEVRNVAGRAIASATVGLQTAGTHVWTWSGHTVGGLRAPTGRYLVTVQGRSEDGTVSTRVLSAMLR